MTSETHPQSHFMRAALDEAATARLQTAPNPWVGCILVRDNAIVGRGATQAPGGAHAERMALSQAGAAARGATAYVTLEPCCHQGRTSPCTDALIEAGVKEVVYALDDPDPQVAGAGARALEAAGIRVQKGVLKEEAAKDLRPYLHQRRTGSAYCLLKVALSLDGRVAAVDGSSQWITGAAAREDVHALRAGSQAILVGTSTAIEDQPRLTVRHPSFKPTKPPLRVILDADGRVPCTGPLFDTSDAPTLIFTSKNCSSDKKSTWERLGIEWEELPLSNKRLDLACALNCLGKRGILQVLVEGGGHVHGDLLEKRLCQEVVVYIGPKVLGPKGRPAFGGLKINCINDAVELELVSATRLESDIRLDYRLGTRDSNEHEE